MMKVLCLTLVIAFGGCSPLAKAFFSVEDPAVTKARVMKVVEGQRLDKEWMKRTGCPIESVPQLLRLPRLAEKDCALDPAGCLKRCLGEDADSCFALAQLIQTHDTVENDVADVLYRNSCRLGIVSGCTNAAAHLFERDDQVSQVCAARTFSASCDKGDAWACTMYGLAALEGIGTEKNRSDSMRYFDKACEVAVEKNGAACIRAKELKSRLTKQD